MLEKHVKQLFVADDSLTKDAHQAECTDSDDAAHGQDFQRQRPFVAMGRHVEALLRKRFCVRIQATFDRYRSEHDASVKDVNEAIAPEGFSENKLAVSVFTIHVGRIVLHRKPSPFGVTGRVGLTTSPLHYSVKGTL